MGRIKGKFLAVCQNRDDVKGFKLLNDMVLQGLVILAQDALVHSCLRLSNACLCRFCR